MLLGALPLMMCGWRELWDETILSQLVFNSYRVGHLGDVSRMNLHMTDYMVWERLYLENEWG